MHTSHDFKFLSYIRNFRSYPDAKPAASNIKGYVAFYQNKVICALSARCGAFSRSTFHSRLTSRPSNMLRPRVLYQYICVIMYQPCCGLCCIIVSLSHCIVYNHKKVEYCTLTLRSLVTVMPWSGELRSPSASSYLLLQAPPYPMV